MVTQKGHSVGFECRPPLGVEESDLEEAGGAGGAGGPVKKPQQLSGGPGPGRGWPWCHRLGTCQWITTLLSP